MQAQVPIDVATGRWTVINQQGKTIMTAYGSERATFSLQGWPSGLYYIQFRAKSGDVYMQKFFLE